MQGHVGLGKENGWSDGPAPGAPAQQPNELWQPPSKGPPLSLDVSGSNTPGGSGTAWAPPVSCPSRLQHGSPARFGSAASFDPFAAAGEEPGCTPMPGAQPAAPPAVHRKASGSADDASPPPAAPRPAVHMADRIQSCPPERVGRRGSRPLTRIRVKRSLNGAVAAAAGPAPWLARRSLDAPPPPPQLAGCSRKRFEEADLVSPPMPRKSSRTLLDESQAADMMARLALARPQPGPADAGDAAQQCHAGAAAMAGAFGSSGGPCFS